MVVLAEGLNCRSRPSWPRALAALVDRCWGPVRHILFCAARAAEGSRVAAEELIRRFQRGQTRAFEALYDRYKDYVYRIALFVTRNSGDAEEAVQETFMDVLRALPHYRIEGPARFETWLYRVALNRCRTLLRRRRPPSADWEDIEEELERLPSPHPNGDPEGSFLRRERATALWRAVNGLPEAQRVVVLLRYQQGLSYEEIAHVLNVNEGTVKSRLHYAHRALKEQLEAENGLPARSRLRGAEG